MAGEHRPPKKREAMAKERIAYYDNMKAILILLVVVGHFVNDFDAYVDIHAVKVAAAWIYTFHMPVFLFVSGLFATHCYSKERGFAAENVLLYFALYVIFRMLSWAEDAILLDGGLDTPCNLFYVSGAPWYLLVLGLLTLSVPFFARMKPVWGIGISIALSIANGWFNTDPALLSLSRFFTYLPAFFIGFYISSEKMTATVKGWREIGLTVKGRRIMGLTTFRILAVAFLAAYFVFLYVLPDQATTLIRHYSTGIHTFSEYADKYPAIPYAFFALLRILHCGLILAIGICIAAITPFTGKGFFTIIGERSLQIYIGHMLVLYYIRQLQIDAVMYAQFDWWPIIVPIEGVLLTCLLAIPKSPNKWVRSLKKACKAVTEK